LSLLPFPFSFTFRTHFALSPASPAQLRPACRRRREDDGPFPLYVPTSLGIASFLVELSALHLDWILAKSRQSQFQNLRCHQLPDPVAMLVAVRRYEVLLPSANRHI
jgi:hypothetical protein